MRLTFEHNSHSVPLLIVITIKTTEYVDEYNSDPIEVYASHVRSKYIGQNAFKKGNVWKKSTKMLKYAKYLKSIKILKKKISMKVINTIFGTYIPISHTV